MTRHAVIGKLENNGVMWASVKRSFSFHPKVDDFPITAHPSVSFLVYY